MFSVRLDEQHGLMTKAFLVRIKVPKGLFSDQIRQLNSSLFRPPNTSCAALFSYCLLLATANSVRKKQERLQPMAPAARVPVCILGFWLATDSSQNSFKKGPPFELVNFVQS